MRQREQYWIDELNSKLNTQKAFTSNEIRKTNIKLYNEKYREQRTYEYNEKLKLYFKDRYKQKKIDRYTCDCGIQLSTISKNRHDQSLFHKNYMESLLVGVNKSLVNEITLSDTNTIG